MIKPEKLKRGDKVAIVSLSWGGLGDEEFIHRYYIAKKRLEDDFGFEVITTPNALKGSEFIYNHPELRAQDLNDAFKDSSIKAIFSAIGGDDSIRILPYIDYDAIKNNPKIFMGYSDTTVAHFIMNKANVCSYYGPAIMSEFAEYVQMLDYTKKELEYILYNDTKNYYIKPSEYWSDDNYSWSEANINRKRIMKKDSKGYEVLNGTGRVKGSLLGGCLEVLTMLNGTEVWPKPKKWKNKLLLIETSEEKPEPTYLLFTLRNFAAQGILNNINGIIVGKPKDEAYYEEYKQIYLKVINEYNLKDLPIIYNVNIGHAYPTGCLPLGYKYELNLDLKTIKMIE